MEEYQKHLVKYLTLCECGLVQTVWSLHLGILRQLQGGSPARDNVSFIKLIAAPHPHPPCPAEGKTMLLMFWLYINEQPGQGTLAKKATKWESHQYRVNFALWKCEWCWVKEVYCIRGAAGISLMLVSILAPLDFRTSQLTTSLLVRVAPDTWVGVGGTPALVPEGPTYPWGRVGGIGQLYLLWIHLNQL